MTFTIFSRPRIINARKFVNVFRKWAPKEKGIATRQTVTTLAKLMQIEPLLIRALVAVDNSVEKG